MYESLELPKRATKGSAGYDFHAPFAFSLPPGSTIKIPTGVRVKMDEGWVLKLYPRSGLGFKYRLQMNNTVGIIDSDYYYSDNESHIFIKMTNDSNEGKTLEVSQERDLPRVFSWNMGLRWTMTLRGLETAVLEVPVSKKEVLANKRCIGEYIDVLVNMRMYL